MAPVILFTSVARRIPTLISHTGTSWLSMTFSVDRWTVGYLECSRFSSDETKHQTLPMGRISYGSVNLSKIKMSFLKFSLDSRPKSYISRNTVEIYGLK